jgi:hypothetical protein
MKQNQTIYYTSIDQLDTFCKKVIPEHDEPEELLTIRSANKWLQRASKLPVPKMLFGKFWYQGELCILFADSNLGKSIIAVQIANSISKGIAIKPFEMEATPQPVLYCDFELSEKQFEARYSNNYQDHYYFNENFSRAELNTEIDTPPGFKNFDEYLGLSLERAIVQSKAKIIIVDNLTYLRSETEQAKDALPLMKQLKALKNRHNLSILALAHTPKRDMGKEITRNDLQGSKMLMNFCDSSFAVGESMREKGMRYLKQIKQRNTDQVFGSSNVCLFKIDKPHNFLQYEFAGYGAEAEHLRVQHGDGYDRADEALKLRDEGLLLREIGERLGVSPQKADRLIKHAQKKQNQ